MLTRAIDTIYHLFFANKSSFSKISKRARVSKTVKYESFVKIKKGSRIEKGCVLGSYVHVGRDTFIDRNCRLKSYVKIANNVVIGKNVTIEAYARIQSGVVIPDGKTIPPHSLVTKDGIIPKRCSGYAAGFHDDYITISGTFGSFFVPNPTRDPHVEVLFSEIVDELTEELQWTKESHLDRYRIDHLPQTQEQVEAAKKIFEAIYWHSSKEEQRSLFTPKRRSNLML